MVNYVSVKVLAEEIGIPVERLLDKLSSAGLSHSSENDEVTEEDKRVLLAFLRSEFDGSSKPPTRLILQRKKRTYVKRGDFRENGGKTDEITHRPPKVFISYSWDNEAHKKWVAQFATELRQSGVDAFIDDWYLRPGDPITEFMEKSISTSDFVLIVCTEKYKEKSDSRSGGVGYEESIISNDLFQNTNHRKYIPIIAKNSNGKNIPRALHSKVYIDLSSEEHYLQSFQKLLLALFGKQPELPPIGNPPTHLL
ncbi:toll/interleukin-1 receptor domain-containing protein [Vibrio cholerae]|uniref:toll/interleukin-1 receptor domain-containing protein n=1 Tax=Vibrio cholerae TaxID=666 RepID=UPI00115D294C|nr:toll/interleukin-1 receptor domain-containing protein [Vibrio cholerae]TQQ01806.1 TIR domain-containing protein [Vibrio cholerae]